MIVAARVDVLEAAGLMESAFSIDTLEEEPFDFVRGVQGVALIAVQLVGVLLEDASQVGAVGLAVFVDDFAEDEHLTRAEDVGGRPVKGVPVEAEAEIALFLCGKAANGGAVKRQIVVRTHEEVLVVVEHVQAAFEVAEDDSDGLDALGVGQIFQALLLDSAEGDALLALVLGGQVLFGELLIRQFEKIAVIA